MTWSLRPSAVGRGYISISRSGTGPDRLERPVHGDEPSPRVGRTRPRAVVRDYRRPATGASAPLRYSPHALCELIGRRSRSATTAWATGVLSDCRLVPLRAYALLLDQTPLPAFDDTTPIIAVPARMREDDFVLFSRSITAACRFINTAHPASIAPHLENAMAYSSIGIR